MKRPHRPKVHVPKSRRLSRGGPSIRKGMRLVNYRAFPAMMGSRPRIYTQEQTINGRRYPILSVPPTWNPAHNAVYGNYGNMPKPGPTNN